MEPMAASRVVFSLCLALLSYNIAEGARGRSLQAAPAIPGPSLTVFNVKTYGASADGETDDRESFMKAWVAACHWRGPAKLLVPKGTFLVGQVAFQGPCNSPTPIVVQVVGNILAQTEISEYPSPEWFSFEEINGLIVTGGGTFDGQGKEVWSFNDCKNNKKCQMFPTSLKFTEVTNGHLYNIHSVNSMGFHMSLVKCKTFNVDHITITAPKDSPNTDGVHISRSSDIKVIDSIIGTGDDCLSIVRGANNIHIERITCGPGHGISVGSLGKYPDEKDVKQVIVKNCTLTDTTNGARIKTWPDSRPSKAVGIHFEDLVFNNVDNPIIIDQAYCPGSSCKNKKPSRVKIIDAHFKNIRGTSASKLAVKLNCSPAFPCQDVQLIDINLSMDPNAKKGDDDDDDDDDHHKKSKKKKHDDDDEDDDKKAKKKKDNDDEGGDTKKAVMSSQCHNVKPAYKGVQLPPPCK